MIISHFNRYFEKHGRKTYIVLGIIISLMFVVFVTPGDIFGGGPSGRNSLGKMYGKKLKTREFAKKMRAADLGSFLLYNRFLSQESSQEALVQETLRRMRAMHEAKKRGLAKVDTSEIVAAIHEMPYFIGKDGNFSTEQFGQFKTNFLARSGLTAADFDNIVKENIIIKRLEKQVTEGIKVDEADVNPWLEVYTLQFAEFNQDTTKAAQPSKEDIEQFFATRKAEITWEKQRAAMVAALSMDDLRTAATSDPAMKALIEPTEEEITRQYETMKDRLYKDKTLEEVKTQIVASLRNRKISDQAKKQANDLAAALTAALTGLEGDARIATFKEVAEGAKAAVSTTGLFSVGDQLPGMEGRHVVLANAIRSLSQVGAITPAVMDGRMYYVACLTDLQPGIQPAELNDEAREKIAEALLTERAMAFYDEKIGIFKDKVPAVKTVWDLADDFNATLASNSSLDEEERNRQAAEYRNGLQELVMPFFKAERRSFRAATFKTETFLDKVVLIESDIVAGYEARKDEYQKVEVRVAQVVVNAPAELSAEEKAAKKAKIEEAAAKLREGVLFEDLVKDYSEDEASKAKGGDSGFLDLAQLDADLSAAYGALELNQVSKVIETPTSFVLAKLLEKKPARDLEQVREELTPILQREKAADLAHEAAVELAENLLTAWSDALDKDAKADPAAIFNSMTEGNAQLEVSQIDKVVQHNYAATGLAREREVMTQVFGAKKEDPFTRPVRGTEGSHVACLLEVLPPSLNSPADDPGVMATLKNVYKRHLAMGNAESEAKAAAARINEALKTEPDLAKAAGETVFKPAKPYSRMKSREMTDFNVRNQEAFMTALAKAPLLSVLPPQKTYGGYVLVYLQERIVPDDEETRKMAENVRSYLLRQKEMEALTEFYKRLEAESETELVDGLMRRAG